MLGPLRQAPRALQRSSELRQPGQYRAVDVAGVPVLLVPINDLVGGMKNGTLNTYFYLWDKKHVAVSLGYGSLYNHSYEPNARYIHGEKQLTYRALRDIEEGEEITINYNFKPEDRTPVAFDVKYQASAQPFLVLGMLVTALAIGHSSLIRPVVEAVPL